MFPTITDKIKNLGPRWLLAIAIIFFIFFLSAGAGLIVFDGMFKNKIYPNIFIGNLNLGGKSGAEAKRMIDQAVDKINQRGVTFSYKDYQTAITPVIASIDGDLAYQIINFNIDGAVNAALSYSRSDNFFINLKNKLLTLVVKKRLALTPSVNREEITKILENNFIKTYEPAQDAKLIIKKVASTGDYEFSITKEKFGKTIDYEEAVNLLITNLSNLDSSEIQLSTITQYPKILAKTGLNIESQAKNILDLAPLTLKYGEDKWLIDKDLLAQFLSIKPDGSTDTPNLENQPADKVKVGLDDDKFKAYLTEQVASKLDKKPVEAKFEINNGKVTEFQNSQDGLALNLESSLIKIEEAIASGNNQIDLVVEAQLALTKTGSINSFGIKEVIGIGASNFAGSPVNRRHNISVGANSVNGTMIKPGEEFSLLKVLGEIGGSTGYLPELVIKEGRTLPEFGGGLCQVGTTVFRAVIASGLPVTMRQNHSYRVVYYEPAGTDATIYNPWPDFRFINDTPAYILIQAKISGDTLSFEFWGTRDARLIETTQPTIYNIVKPESTKIVETLALKPGEKKCTERAHNGADAFFDYKVTYGSGEIKAKRFSSHYVPWREVCLLGVEKLSPPAGGPETAPSTPLGIGTSTPLIAN
ncbi:MAG: VanW family protein [bacterium]|nr:VanW family protein [bacterium]